VGSSVGDIASFFVNTLSYEDLVLPLLWERYHNDSETFLLSFERLRLHLMKYVEVHVDYYLNEYHRHLENQVAEVYLNTQKEYLALQEKAFKKLKDRVLLAYNMILDETYDEALVTLTSMKLWLSDAVEESMPLASESASLKETSLELQDLAASPLSQLTTDQRLAGHPSDISYGDAGKQPLLGQQPLSKRERDIISLLKDGKTNASIASVLGLKEKTVKNYVSTILNKLQLDSRTQLAIYAIRNTI
jgi:DNA-binding CsgD family transcriptional regulator